MSMLNKIKIICINSDSFDNLLTIGKVYDGIDMKTQNHVIQTDCYNITDDNGWSVSFNKNRFITLAEWRDKQINELLE